MADVNIKRALILALIGISFSCHRTIADRYTEEELVNIMLDAHTLGLIYNRQDVRTDTLKVAYYEVIEERYGIRRDEFQEVVEDLVMDAELYDRVYSRMVKITERMEQRGMEEM